jgi:hypothetical protein
VVELANRQLRFSEPGVDAYWSSDGSRMIYLSKAGRTPSVSIRHQADGRITRDVAPWQLGDYYSWGVRDGRDMILTIEGNYYFLDGDTARLPAAALTECPGIGRGARPLLSKDGRRATVFVNRKLVVRDVDSCAELIDTGIEGAKADFSWDGRYIAFHAAKPDLTGYEVRVVDLERRTVRTIGDLPGSSLFPSWTRDGRLCFRYDGEDYRGFIVAENVLAAPERPLLPAAPVRSALRWHDVFPETPEARRPISIVTVWATWSAHTPMALSALQRAEQELQDGAPQVALFDAVEFGSLPSEAARLRQRYSMHVADIPLAPPRLGLTGASNQIPANVLFRDGVLVDTRLGALNAQQLVAWAREALRADLRHLPPRVEARMPHEDAVHHSASALE